MSLIITNGKQVTKDNQLVDIHLKIDGKKIVAVSEQLDFDVADNDQVIDVAGKLVTPGLTDVHVHFRQPGFEDKETILTGSQAAARGGFTRVAAMPNLNPAPDTPEKLNAIQKLIDEDSVIEVLQYAPITGDLKSDDLVDMANMPEAFAFTNDGFGVQTAGTMYLAMKEAARLHKPIVAHTEDESLLFGGVMHEGVKNKELGLPGILNATESSQIARDIHLAEETGVHYHVCHVSTKASVAAIRDGKARGVHVTAEVAPHHLILNELDIPADDATFKMNPPLRGEEDQAALLEGLLDGTLDMVATDHAPHTLAEKANGFMGSPFGIVGIETAFAVMYTHFVKTGIMSLAFLLEKMVTAPTDVFDLAPATLSVGSSADIAVFDLSQAYTIDPADYLSKSQVTPFNGEEVFGMCALTIYQGNIVYQQ
ncbi:dihydroorotase [Aerococcus urinaeequi]|uniref:dihydroorotase n=2 Tax=Aerococcus TaxID=1375 RepID=UPI003D6BA558